MRGHEAIVRMRLRGLSPGVVFVHDDLPTGDDQWRRWAELGEVATVELAATDRPKSLDLRFCVGLSVMLNGRDQSRVMAACAAFVAAGASRVVWVVEGGADRRFEPIAAGDTWLKH